VQWVVSFPVKAEVYSKLDLAHVSIKKCLLVMIELKQQEFSNTPTVINIENKIFLIVMIIPYDL